MDDARSGTGLAAVYMRSYTEESGTESQTIEVIPRARSPAVLRWIAQDALSIDCTIL